MYYIEYKERAFPKPYCDVLVKTMSKLFEYSEEQARIELEILIKNKYWQYMLEHEEYWYEFEEITP